MGRIKSHFRPCQFVCSESQKIKGSCGIDAYLYRRGPCQSGYATTSACHLQPSNPSTFISTRFLHLSITDFPIRTPFIPIIPQVPRSKHSGATDSQAGAPRTHHSPHLHSRPQHPPCRPTRVSCHKLQPQFHTGIEPLSNSLPL